MSDDTERCVCGEMVALSNKWWHRSVCRGWQAGAAPVGSMVEIVARAMAIAEGVGEHQWEAYLDLARPAIRAMRDPTADMVDAGASTVWNRDALVGAYQAMIDAAGRDVAGPNASEQP